MIMRVLITDDEPLAQVALANILSKRSDVEHFDLARDGVEALEKLSKESYDVLLLDISMPEISGIELLDRIKKADRVAPSVVFVTAHGEHAIAAFQKHAVDYVLKPFSSERVNEALDVAFRRTAGERAARLVEDLPRFHGLLRRTAARIAIKAGGRILFIDPSDLLAVHAEGNYVLLQSKGGSNLLRESISVMEDKLKPYGFIRIHRSVLINAEFVEEVRPLPTGEYCLVMRGGSEHTVTRKYKKNLKAIAGAWIGVEGFVDK
ncbi:MAG: LytTR family DNA-binding domain-containing protein [Terracidiphilus sp.]|jgi:two-component system LytT family response regulator